MMNNKFGDIEKRIKDEFDGITFPEKNLVGAVKQMIENGETNNSDKIISFAGKKSSTMRKFNKVAAIIVLVLALSGSACVYAAYNEISFSEIMELLWGKEAVDDIEQLYCDVEIVEENTTIEDVSFNVTKVIGDSNGVYIVIRYETDNDNLLAKDVAELFTDVSVKWEGMAAVSSDIIPLATTDDNNLFAVECIAENDCEKLEMKERKENIVLNLSGEEGIYKIKLKHKFTGEVRRIEHNMVKYKITPLTVSCSPDSEDGYYDIMDRNVMLITNEGDKIKCELNYGLELDNEYVISYNNEVPVNPENIRTVIVEGMEP